MTLESSDDAGKRMTSDVFCCRDVSCQDQWIQALINCGVHFKEDQDELVKGAKSLFEFSAPDQTHKEVPLSRYEGNVCLVVNVASK